MSSSGVLLVNLGTTDAPTPKAVRRYFREFLGDRMVIDRPSRPVWWLILNLFVLPRRPGKVAPLYEKIWMPEGAPLTVYTRRQSEALATRLDRPVGFGMRYGNPSITSALAGLKAEGCTHVRVVPMFPQVSRSSWGTAVDATQAAAAKLGVDVSIVEPFYDHPAYIGALAALVREEIADAPPDHFLFSFHGLPVRFGTQYGDPYEKHCQATANALAAALELADGSWTLSYQSRFGREQWLEPVTATVVAGRARTHRSLVVVCPGFPADCLETIDEIGNLARESFLSHGGEDLRLVHGLNDHPAWIEGLANIVG
jgi:protoporphyrin/coproporphyrin ferrochelatase